IILKYCSSIMRLLSRTGNRGPASLAAEDAPPDSNSGLDPSIIARIPMKNFNSKDAFSGAEFCSVCLTEFREGEA
ncbi:hypothetical protein KI387_006468, partial [Taxus chinensis]